MFTKGVAIASVSVALTLGMSLPSVAQQTDSNQIDCSIAANQDDPVCLGLPQDGAPITNFVPIVAPLLGAAALAGLAGSGGTSGTTSTTTTTSTTSTTPGG